MIQYKNNYGEFEFVKDEKGNIIKSRMEEGTLQKIAAITGGMYVKAGGAQFGLDIIYEEKLSKMEKRSLEATMQKRYHERFQIPLAIAIILLCIEMLVPLRRKD